MKKITKKDIIDDLVHHIYCRLRPSETHGIGVFAIRKIPAGINPFLGLQNERLGGVNVSEVEIEDRPDIPEAVKVMVRDFYTVRDGQIEFPSHGLNEINISYCMNTSRKPNVGSRDDGETYYTLVDIFPGEELTIDYHKISDKHLIVDA